MRARKNKRNIFFRKSSWLLIVIFIATLITIPSFTTKTEAAVRTGTVSAKFKILDIDPGATNFTIGSGSGRTYTPGDIIDGRSVEVTRISMAEFNSMVDEIKGQYDAVVIGRNKTNLIKDFSYDNQYRDYSSPFYQEFTELNVSGNRMNTSNSADIRNKVKYSSASVDSGLKYSGNFTDSTGKTFIEYYSENDITKKRAKEIKAMLDGDVNGDGKELVYIASEIFSDNDLKASNLYNEFNSYNTAKVPQSNITLTKIKNDYQNRNVSLKRPTVTKLEMSDDDRNITDVTKVNVSTRNMEYTLTIPNGDELKVSLYLDFNGDGILNKEENSNERIKTNEELKNFKVPNTTDKYKITYQMDPTFIGYLDWKIDLSKSNDVKTSVNGDYIFKAIPGKEKIIKVLQIYPKTKTDGANLYLNKDDSGTVVQKKFNEQVAADLVKKSGYILDIANSICCDDFNNAINGNPDYLDDYDMIIVGFSDNYGDGANKRDGYSNQFSQNSVNAIEAFIKKKKAVMLTHDTITLNTFGDTYMNVGPKLLGKGLRDYVGQARYADVYRNGNEKGLDSNTNIIHDPLIPAGTAGATRYGSNSNLTSMGATLYINQYASTLTTTVRSINNAQITKYPFDISATATIPVAPTHAQWYQLDLEDPDVVPWYNISNGSKFDAGDSRNYYYTYSKGNVTYSGTGHSNDGKYTDTELQLFVNTIIKASRGANNPPSITNYTPSGYVEQKEIATGSTVSPEVQRNSDYEFISVPFDIDGDGMKVTVKAIGLNSSGGQVSSQVVYSDMEYSEYKTTNPVNGLREKVKIDLKIPKTLYENNSNVTKVKVETTVEDITGAIVPNSFYIQISNNKAPTIINKYLNKTEIGNGTIIPNKVLKTSDYEFITLPNDGNDAKVDVTMTADGQPIYEVDNNGNNITTTSKTSNQEIKVKIPKGYYENKSQITITTTVKDAAGAFDTKTFILKINQAPTIKNYNLDNEEFTAQILENTVVKRTDAYYDFISIPSDTDDPEVDVTMTVEGQSIYEVDTNGNNITTSNKVRDQQIKVRIPKTIYEYKNEITVTTTVTDKMGVYETKTFKLTVSSNSLPTINNYYLANYDTAPEEIITGTKVDGTKDYEFYSVPKDEEDKQVFVTITADGQEVYDEIGAVIKDSIKDTDTGIKARIPQSVLANKTSIIVQTKVTDKMGASQTEEFTLNINEKPTITNRDLEDKPITSDNIVPIVISGTDNYDFISLPIDKDDETVKVTITAAGQDVMQKTITDSWATGINTKEEKSGTDIFVRIPKKIFEDEIAKGNKEITVVTTVVDGMGLSDSKSFKIRINEAPSIYNYYKGAGAMGQGADIGVAVINEVSRTVDFDFVSIPTDPNDAEVKVTITVDGEYLKQITTNEITNEEVLLSISGINTVINTGMKVRIPKEILINKVNEGEDEITVTTKVEDKMGLSQTKQFTVKIKNEAPIITNYDENGINEITSDDKISVTRIANFNFKTKPIDPEGRAMTLTVQLDDGTVISNLTPITGAISAVKTGFEISKVNFADKTPGDEIKVTVTAKDDKGNEASKVFTLVITNLPPTIVNYDNDGTDPLSTVTDITVSKTENYEFKTLPTDPEGKPLTLKVTLKDGTEISTSSGAVSGEKAQLEIPKANFVGKIPGEKVEIVVIAIDEDGSEAKQGFTLVIGNIDPIVTHMLDGTDIYNYFPYVDNNPVTRYVYYFKNLDFVGNITKVYNKNATVTLKLDDNEILGTTGGNIKLIGEVSVEMVNSDGTITPLGNMTGSNGSYSYLLSDYNITTIPDDGIELIVKYSAEIYRLPGNTETSYKNTLSIESINTPITIKTLRPDADPDLF